MDTNGVIELNFCYGCMAPLPEDTHICPSCGHDNTIVDQTGEILPEGTILHGRYLIGRMIGRGGFGATYLALDLVSRERLAIKEYFPLELSKRNPYTFDVVFTANDSQDFQKGCESFRNEALSLSRFNSQSIVHVREFFREHGTAYIVMDFVDGNRLSDEITECGGKIPYKRVLALVKPLIKELDNIHQENLIHRDIKPDNLIIVKDEGNQEHLVLLDFGSARSYASTQSKRFTAMVTPGYAPIEQYSQMSRQGPYTDIYSLCGTMYAAITGTKPPAATERLERELDIKPFIQLGIRIPANIERAIQHGLELKSERRPQSMRELYSELFNEAFSSDENVEETLPVEENEDWQNSVYESAKKAMVSRTTEGYKKAYELLVRVPTWRSAPVLLDTCKKELAQAGIYAEKNDDIYEIVKEKIAENDYPSYMAAQSMLKVIPGWRDADELAFQVNRTILERNQIYQNARNNMERGDRPSLSEAERMLKNIPGWLDADELAEECRTELEKTEKYVPADNSDQAASNNNLETGNDYSEYDKFKDYVPDDEKEKQIDDEDQLHRKRTIWIFVIIFLIIAVLAIDYYLRRDNSVFYQLYEFIADKIRTLFV